MMTDAEYSHNEGDPCPVCEHDDYAECRCSFDELFGFATKLRADLAAMTAERAADTREWERAADDYANQINRLLAERDVAVKRADALTEALREVLDALPSSCSDGSHGDELAEQITDAEALLAGTQGEDSNHLTVEQMYGPQGEDDRDA